MSGKVWVITKNSILFGGSPIMVQDAEGTLDPETWAAEHGVRNHRRSTSSPN